jgi:hypothetical protein
MTDFAPQCAVVSLPDIELQAQISCASRRLIVIAPGVTEPVAQSIADKWKQLGPSSVQIVLDADPEVCRMGFGDLGGMKLLQQAAEELGARIHQQPGLRVGVVITDETTTIYSPVPRLVEAGGAPGERLNALRFDAPLIQPTTESTDLKEIDLHPATISRKDIKNAEQDLSSNPPVKFDLARKVRVFNARFEFVEFELRGLFLSRKRVQIPSDLFGLAREPKAQKLLRSSFQLLEESSELSGERVTKLKQYIAKRYLIPLPGHGSVILRSNKEDFQSAVRSLERYVHRFQKRLKKQLQAAIDSNREVLMAAILPTVTKNPPVRWKRYLGDHANSQQVESLLRRELTEAFGLSDDVLEEMKVKIIFKGVTYESLNDPDFIRIALEKIPSLEALHDEFDAAKAKGQTA